MLSALRQLQVKGRQNELVEMASVMPSDKTVVIHFMRRYG